MLGLCDLAGVCALYVLPGLVGCVETRGVLCIACILVAPLFVETDLTPFVLVALGAVSTRGVAGTATLDELLYPRVADEVSFLN